MILDNDFNSTIINEIIKDTDLSKEDVKDLINFQFKYVKDVMESGYSNFTGNFPSVRIMYIGKFYCSNPKLKRYLEYVNDTRNISSK